MPQTIIDLWRGDIGPIDRCGIGDREANMLSLQMERSETKTEALLTEEQKVLFQAFVQTTDRYYARMMELAFQEGFSLGSKLTAEALT